MKPRTPVLLFSLFLSLLLIDAKAASDTEADLALAKARSFAAKEQYAEALEQHLWYHEHALESAPSHYGVRLSFALLEWHRLGEKYPPALEAMRRVRDEKTARLSRGEANRPLFHDVTSLNRELGEPEATVALFRRLDERSPFFAGEVIDIADEALAARREYPLLRKHLGDPAQVLRKAIASFRDGMAYAKTSRDPEMSRASFEQIFNERVARLIVTLRETGDPKIAARIRREALAVHDSETIRQALPD